MAPRQPQSGGGSRERAGAPSQSDIASTTPQTPMLDHSFGLQAIMEMQRTLGKVEQKIENVDRHVVQIAAEVSKHGKWIYAATVVCVLALAGIGWMTKILWDIVRAKLGIPG